MAGPIEAFYAIALIGVAYAVVSLIITNRFGNRARVKEIQGQINSITKAYNEALKKNDPAEVKRLEAENAKVPGLLKESMVLQFKPLVILLPFLLILPALAKFLYPDFTINLSFSIPVFIQHFERFPNWRNEFGAVGWFWLSFLFSSLLVQAVIGISKKLKSRRA